MRQCDLINLDGTFGYVCSNGLKALPKCEFCHRQPGANKCDYPLGGPCPKCKGKGVRNPNKREKAFEASLVAICDGADGEMTADKANEALFLLRKSFNCHDCAATGKAQCNRYFCGTVCGVRVSEDEGYCPDHNERAGKPRPLIRERCWWIDKAKFGGNCLHRGCTHVIEVDERALYFPDRRRVMCADCGESYLLKSVVAQASN